MKCFLRVGNDYLEDSVKCPSITYAMAEFKAINDEITSYGNQAIEASIHVGDSIGDIQEYPDFILTYGPRGGVKKYTA